MALLADGTARRRWIRQRLRMLILLPRLYAYTMIIWIMGTLAMSSYHFFAYPLLSPRAGLAHSDFTWQKDIYVCLVF